MGYEEQYLIAKTACPCGNGHVMKESRSNDWGQNYSNHYFDCEYCLKTYTLEVESHDHYKRGRGCYYTYSAIPNDYPEYSGFKQSDLYDEPLSFGLVSQRVEQSFEKYVCEQFSKESLLNIKVNADNTTAAHKLTDGSKLFAKLLYRYCHKRDIRSVRQYVALALDYYDHYNANFDNRKIARGREFNERLAYEEEKDQHRIYLTDRKLSTPVHVKLKHPERWL